MKSFFLSAGLFLIILLSGSFLSQPDILLEDSMSVNTVLEKLKDSPNPNKPDMSMPGVSAKKGEELVKEGITTSRRGGKVKKLSKHFVCTSCHNIEREDPDLTKSDPQARLMYANEKGIPFLQGTTFYGAVNRTNFYNGDYEKKYGELVIPARNNIREAIQLCAIECSQGRRLKDWELESILAYFWTIDLKIGDLDLSTDETETINKALNDSGDKAKAIELIKEHYLDGSPATFVDPPKNRREGYEYTGNAENGKLIYDLSCKFCHENKRYAFFELDDSAYSFKYMKRHMSRYTRYSLYQVARYGTSPLNGKRAYMPNYTLEKMSHQQVEDLRAYIEQQAQ